MLHLTVLLLAVLFLCFRLRRAANIKLLAKRNELQALKNEPIAIFGDGLHTRSFCYVDDLINAMILMMEKEGITGPVNIGNPDEYTIKQIADKIISMTESTSNVTFLPLPTDDPTRRRPNIALAKKELGWEPQIGLEEGLKKTIEYFNNPDYFSTELPR